MNTELKPVENGACDGMGCGANPIHIDHLCFCKEYTNMRNEYQRVTGRPWTSADPDCKAWDNAWRFLWVRINK